MTAPHEDPDDAPPWAMQLVALIPRIAPPTRTGVCEAAATAVVALLCDERAQDGPWQAMVTRWTAGRIRKVVRRARGAAWEAAQDLDGVTVEVGGASVRAFVPGPVDQVPAALARLQVGGTEVPEIGDPSAAVPDGLTIAVTPEVTMTAGKAAAQCGHAAQLALATLSDEGRTTWQRAGFPLRVLFPDAATWVVMLHTFPVAVHDGGFTEVAPGTLTAVARWAVAAPADQ